jgi:glycosyltransferase involved in cell wall biosynthesis
MKSPAVSVIIPTRNRSQLVGRAIQSVLAQSFEDFELIIVDDASEDGTPEALAAFIDPRLKIFRNSRRLGGSGARNRGIASSTGRFVAFLDDDDEWFLQKLEKQVAKFKECSTEVGLIYCGFEVKSEKDTRIVMPRDRGDLRMRLLMGTTLGSPTPLIQKACFDEVGVFDESLESCQDWDMWKRISEKYQFDYVPEVLARLYMHGSQISYNLNAMIPGRTAMVKKHMDEFRQYPEIFVIHLKQLGKLHCINGTWRQAMQWFKEAVKVDHYQMLKIIAWCVIELPKIKYFSRARHFKPYVNDAISGKNL